MRADGIFAVDDYPRYPPDRAKSLLGKGLMHVPWDRLPQRHLASARGLILPFF